MKLNVLVLFAILLGVSLSGVAQGPAVNPLEVQSYQIGPGDIITGKVLGEEDFNFISAVGEDGRIQVPFFEQGVYAKCKTEKQLREEVADLLGKYLKNPQVTVQVTERKSRPPATVYGEVRTPQQIILTRKATLLELISFSGGVTEEAGGMIQIFRTQRPICSNPDEDNDWTAGGGLDVPSRLYSLSGLREGREESNPVIFPGDVIVVQKASPVYITGEVVAPQGIFLKEGGLSLTEALAMIGGVRREAKTKDIKIHRLKQNSKEREVIAVNFDLIKKGEQKDVMLEPYDIIEVDKSRRGFFETLLEVVTGATRTGISSVTGGLGTRILY